MQDSTDDNDQKLAVLRAMAAEGFRQLDQGQGIVIDDDRQLASFIAEIGRRAEERIKRGGDSG